MATSVKNRINAIETKKQNALKKIFNAETKAVGAIQKAKTASLNFINKPKQWVYKKIDNGWLKKKDSDSKAVAGLKNVARHVAKAPVALVSAAITAPVQVAVRAASGLSKWAVIGAGQVATLVPRAVSGIAKAPLRIVNAPIVVFRTTKYLLKPKNALNFIGSIVEQTGDRMTRNKMTKRQSDQKADRERRAREEAEEKQRLKDEQERERDN